jgi:hypothetical protein
MVYMPYCLHQTFDLALPMTLAPDTLQQIAVIARPPSQPLPIQGAPAGRFGMHNGPALPPTFVKLLPGNQTHSSSQDYPKSKSKKDNSVALADPLCSHLSTAKPSTVTSLPLRSMLSSAQARFLQLLFSGSHCRDSLR